MLIMIDVDSVLSRYWSRIVHSVSDTMVIQEYARIVCPSSVSLSVLAATDDVWDCTASNHLLTFGDIVFFRIGDVLAMGRCTAILTVSHRGQRCIIHLFGSTDDKRIPPPADRRRVSRQTMVD